jgi:predicted Zn-dependent protease
MSVCRQAALLFFGISLAAQEPGKPVENVVNSYSLEKEAALGRQMAFETQQRTVAINDPDVEDYVKRLGLRISAQIPDAKFPYTFSVITDDSCPSLHEPLALPGGYVFVPAALIVEAHDEAEFASMLAHSMEHVAQRQATRLATRSQLVNYGSIPLVFMGGWTGGCSEALAIPVGFLAMQRDNELEADGLAVQAIARAGFDPEALLRYIERVQVQPAKVFSSLPGRDQRVTAIRLVIEGLPASEYQVTSGDFAAIQKEVIRLTEHRQAVHVAPTLLR